MIVIVVAVVVVIIEVIVEKEEVEVAAAKGGDGVTVTVMCYAQSSLNTPESLRFRCNQKRKLSGVKHFFWHFLV